MPILLVVSSTGKMTVPSRVSLLISILRLNLVLTDGIPPEFRVGMYIFIAFTAEGPPVHWAISLQGSSSNKYW